MKKFAAPKGMRDFDPGALRTRDGLFEAWRTAARLYGFEMYETPVVETMDLLERKAGEEISEQIYLLAEKGSQRLALRAELTPSLARMIIERQAGLSLPIKWSAIGQCFRYERMQKGRKREHYQLNLDIIGEPSVVAEAEVIGAALASLRSFGFTAAEIGVKIGSRRLLAALFAKSGISADHFTACCLALDKRGKINDEAVGALLRNEGVADDDVVRIFELLALTTFEQVRDFCNGDAEAEAALAEMSELFTLAEALGFAEFLHFDLGVIRGLGYYTGIVFEAFDIVGKYRAIFGGGRYDSLLSSLGGQTMPCVGLGFGDVVAMDLLEDYGRLPASARSIDAIVGYMNDECRPLALKIAAAIRATGRSTDLCLSPDKPKKFFNRANKGGAEWAVYIGPDEMDSGNFTLKPMHGGEPVAATLETLIEVLG